MFISCIIKFSFFIVLESAWRVPDWPSMKEALAQVMCDQSEHDVRMAGTGCDGMVRVLVRVQVRVMVRVLMLVRVQVRVRFGIV